MNIAQIKQDLANGVMIGRETWRELVDYALKQELTLTELLAKVEHKDDTGPIDSAYQGDDFQCGVVKQ